MIFVICFVILSISMVLATFRKKPEVYEVFIHDKYYDMMEDNDDYEDIPTIVRVEYNSKGEILDVSFADTTSDLCDNESPMVEKMKFFDTCNINPYGGIEEYKKFSIWKKRKS